jgi:hypothetical protein
MCNVRWFTGYPAEKAAPQKRPVSRLTNDSYLKLILLNERGSAATLKENLILRHESGKTKTSYKRKKEHSPGTLGPVPE